MIKRLPQSNNKSSASTDLCTIIVNPQQISELCQQKYSKSACGPEMFIKSLSESPYNFYWNHIPMTMQQSEGIYLLPLDPLEALSCLSPFQAFSFRPHVTLLLNIHLFSAYIKTSATSKRPCINIK
jgi:hypothetical protein